MSNYTKSTNFTAKDSLASGDPNKRINGSLFDQEFDPISTAVGTKIDKVTGEVGEVPVFTSSGGLESSNFTIAQLGMPAGTKMSFYQAAAPTGWTQDTSKANYTMRVVSGTGGGSGGSGNPISFTVAAHVHTTSGHTLTVSEIPSHNHDTRRRASAAGSCTDALEGSNGALASEDCVTDAVKYTGGGGSHTHGNTGSNGGGTFSPKYIDVILATKD